MTGPKAFPEIVTRSTTDLMGRHYGDVMSMGGMSLRDYFAAQALQGICAAYDESTRLESGRHVAEFDWAARMSYEFADAMLKAREQR